MGTHAAPHVRIAIVGSGFAGIGLGVRLRQEGVTDFVILERAAGLGGVWRANTYPGCACDVESHLYSFSFAPNPRWSRTYSPQAEILAYLEDVAARTGVTGHLRFEEELLEARWSETDRRWHLRTSRGELTADALVGAQGGLSEPSIPDLPGLASFAGKVMHSAAWDHGFALAGKRVAVVGTGASAVQIVPSIQPSVAQLTVFQRTAPWVVPRDDRPVSPLRRQLYQRLPFVQRLARAGIYSRREALVLGFRNPRVMRVIEGVARRHLRRQVRDPALRARLTPDYRMGCKRILLSDDYLATFEKPGVALETSPIHAITPDGIVTADGREHAFDAIVLGTGFRVADIKIAHLVRGRGARTLHEVWAGSPVAHLGTTVSGFPGLYLLQGPHTGLGHTSVILMIESQIEHVVAALAYTARHRLAALEPRAEAQAAFVAECEADLAGTVWTAGGCKSWYMDRNGRATALWPHSTLAFERRVLPFDPHDYTMIPQVSPSLSPKAASAPRAEVS